MATPDAAGWHTDPEDPTLERYWNGEQWTDQTDDKSWSPDAKPGSPTTDPGTEEPPPAQPTPPVTAPSSRSIGLGVAFAIAVIAFVAGFGARMVTGPDHVSVAADQFCAMGTGGGASLLDTAGWLKGAQRTVDDFDDVLRAIDDQCPAWRQQVVARSNDLGN